MKCTLAGIRGQFLSQRSNVAKACAGFTLVEVLVALSLLLAFVAALGPVLSHGRQILVRGNGDIRAELLLRSLLDPALDPSNAETGSREGEIDGFRWRITVEPFSGGSLPGSDREGDVSTTYRWTLRKMIARVDWGADRSLSAESLRLIRVN